MDRIYMDNAATTPLCPEALGGLPCPRPPAEICAGTGTDVLAGNARVINAAGQDVTAQYVHGAQAVLALCQLYDVTEVLLMPRSPSCGCGQIYNGTFTRTLIPGDGVAAELLMANSVRVLGESELADAFCKDKADYECSASQSMATLA